ncbi:MAG: fructose bisphosphate aldolase [Rubellimicrobium sp.]|nr:fructose bisphosphate aldolase [Rubellimicrobium sp.]
MNHDMATRMRDGNGFIAALDQSGGSTPRALRLYGIDDSAWSSEAGMFDLVHDMRARIVGSAAFSGDNIIGAILFEQTMDRDFHGKPAAEYLWQDRGVVPFLKIDQGLAPEADGCQMMKHIPGLDALLERARAKGIFGTKERSVISAANADGIRAVVEQQFTMGEQVLAHDLMPILEPEITITIPDKAAAEAILREELLRHLDAFPVGKQVMLKLSLPSEDNFYAPLVDHPAVMRVVALSGGYTRDQANAILARNRGVIASFSRALTEGLNAGQTEAEFDALLLQSVASIYTASVSG